MGPLQARKHWRRRGEGRFSRGFQVDLHSLVTHQLHACPPMSPTTPVSPEERRIPDDERMQEDAHLTRLLGGAALPLTLLAQWTRTAGANAGGIDHAQAAISFSTSLLGDQRAPCWTPKRPIRLERKV